jgi:hypothetical protein
MFVDNMLKLLDRELAGFQHPVDEAQEAVEVGAWSF